MLKLPPPQVLNYTKMRFCLVLLITAVVLGGILLLTSVSEVSGSPSPKKRKGSSSSSSSASRPSRPFSSSSGGGSKSKSKSSFFGGGSKYKPKDSKVSKKSFAKKHWKKALAFGAGAYVGYKITKKVGCNELVLELTLRALLQIPKCQNNK